MLSRMKVAPHFIQSIGYRWQIALLCTLVVSLAACGSTAETADNTDLQITLLPIAVGEASGVLRVQLHNAAQEPITDATVTLEGNMNHAGMAPVIADPLTDDADGTLDGIYQAPFQFSMLGDWILTVAVERADGSKTTKDIHVTVTEAGIQIHDAAPSGSAQTGVESTGQMMVHDVMVRAVPVAGGNGAIYFTVMNGTDQAERLVAVESDVAVAAEMHESINVNNVIRMEPRPDGFEIPAGGSVALTPGGKHVMLLNLKQPLTEGETIAITLRFEHAEPLSVTVPIVALGSTMEGEHQHGD